jgi:hypothetical protein
MPAPKGNNYASNKAAKKFLSGFKDLSGQKKSGLNPKAID